MKFASFLVYGIMQWQQIQRTNTEHTAFNWNKSAILGDSIFR